MNHWVWVFGEIEALRWVLKHRRMAFADSARERALQIRRGDRAVLYVTRGAFHNPSRDQAHLAGLVTVTRGCQQAEPIEIAGREFTWMCRFQPDVVLPERTGPAVHEIVETLAIVSKPAAWGQYFRRPPVRINQEDFHRLATAVRNAATEAELHGQATRVN